MTGDVSPPEHSGPPAGSGPPDLAATDSAIVRAFAEAGQGHVFRFLDSLSRPGREQLLADARGVDLDLIGRLSGAFGRGERPAPRLEPIDAIGPEHPDRARAEAVGADLFREGRVAFFTVAGGQGTRLGFDGPKGAYPLIPGTGKTLFAWHAEKVLAASRRYGRDVPWVLMVSETNEEETRRHFDDDGWYGLGDRVRLVKQRMLPAVDATGRILLASPGRIALSPNGHGGSLEALDRGGALDWLAGRGVELVSYFQVDNPLLDAADLAFLGHHRLAGAEMSAKVVMKNDPLERAGVVVTVDGRPGVVEYSELPEELARATLADGRLKFGLANIAAHAFSLDFLMRMKDAGLPYHTAVKTVATVDDAGAPIEMSGHKFETFVFDAIPLANRFNVFLTERWEDFAPLKNAEGDDSPETVRAALVERVRRWSDLAGEPAPSSEEEAWAVSPNVAYDRRTYAEYTKSGAGR